MESIGGKKEEKEIEGSRKDRGSRKAMLKEMEYRERENKEEVREDIEGKKDR